MTFHNAQRVRWGIFIILLTVAVLKTGVAPASNQGDTVETIRFECTNISQSEVDRIMRLELRSSASVGNVKSRATSIRISCVRNEIVMSAQDGETGYLSTRRIQLTDDSLVGRERMIALAAAELILSSWEQIAETNTRSATNVEMSDEQHDDGTMSHLEPTTTIAQKKTTRSTPHARKRLAAPSRHPVQEEADPPENSRPLNSETVLLRELGLRVSATGQLFPSAKLWLWGGELAGMLVWNDAFELQLSGGASGGQATRRSGTASLFWSGGALLLGVRGTPFFSGLRGALLAGFRWGYGRLHGRPRTGEIRGHVVSGPNGGPLMRLSLALPVRPRIGVSMEMGYAAWGIKGYVAGASDVNMSEWWGMLAINLCFIRRLHDKK